MSISWFQMSTVNGLHAMLLYVACRSVLRAMLLNQSHMHALLTHLLTHALINVHASLAELPPPFCTGRQTGHKADQTQHPPWLPYSPCILLWVVPLSVLPSRLLAASFMRFGC